MNAMQQVVGRLFAAKYFTQEAKEDVSLFSKLQLFIVSLDF